MSQGLNNQHWDLEDWLDLLLKDVLFVKTGTDYQLKKIYNSSLETNQKNCYNLHGFSQPKVENINSLGLKRLDRFIGGPKKSPF